MDLITILHDNWKIKEPSSYEPVNASMDSNPSFIITHILCISITTSRLWIKLSLLSNEITFSIPSRRALCAINWNALFDVMHGADAMDGIPHLKQKTNTSTENGPSPCAIYLVPWRLTTLSEWMVWRHSYYPLNLNLKKDRWKKWISIFYPIFVTKKNAIKVIVEKW